MKDRKVAVITNVGSGSGRAIALRLAKDGFDVVVSDINKDIVCTVSEEIKAFGRKALAIVADVSNEKFVKVLVNSVVNELGKIDLLVANATISEEKTFDKKGSKSNQTLKLTSVLLCAQAVARQMMKQKKGKIINCVSIPGELSCEMYKQFKITNFAVAGFTQALARELQPYGITVNAYCPSIVVNANSMKEDVSSDTEMKFFFHHNLFDLEERPEEISCLISYLASPITDYMTGQIVNKYAEAIIN